MTSRASDVVLAFLSALHALPARPGVFNPWVDSEPGYEERADAPAIRSTKRFCRSWSSSLPASEPSSMPYERFSD